jgi:hypothetical protein
LITHTHLLHFGRTHHIRRPQIDPVLQISSARTRDHIRIQRTPRRPIRSIIRCARAKSNRCPSRHHLRRVHFRPTHRLPRIQRTRRERTTRRILSAAHPVYRQFGRAIDARVLMIQHHRRVQDGCRRYNRCLQHIVQVISRLPSIPLDPKDVIRRLVWV